MSKKELRMTPNRMTHCPFGGGIKKIFLLGSILSLVALLSVVDFGNYNREESASGGGQQQRAARQVRKQHPQANKGQATRASRKGRTKAGSGGGKKRVERRKKREN